MGQPCDPDYGSWDWFQLEFCVRDGLFFVDSGPDSGDQHDLIITDTEDLVFAETNDHHTAFMPLQLHFRHLGQTNQGQDDNGSTVSSQGYL